MKEYRIVHELGPRFAAPIRFDDLDLAKREFENIREVSKTIHADDSSIANGWRIESRIVTEWETESLGEVA